jgi:nicotinate-nucleotide pyrophosphorylase (carboxylating)
MILPSASQIQSQVTEALAEDVGAGDLTASLINSNMLAQATVISRESAVVCGVAWFNEVFAQVDATIEIDWAVVDGDEVEADQVLCRIQGSASAVLTAERTALNFLQTLSATASKAAEYVKAVEDTGVRILDTRKTIPGLRMAQKYAVTCGGASNHRMGLHDAILIKENHIESAGTVTAALHRAFAEHPNVEIEIEVETHEQLEEALAAGVKRVLLDNMSLPQLREAVEINQGRARLEASGGVNLDTVRDIAQTGVDDISVGEITKDIRAIDFSMRFVAEA